MWAAGDGMVELYQCLPGVFKNREVDFSLVVVPVKVNAEVSLVCPIMGDGVMLSEDSHKVLSMRCSHIFDAEIVHAKREADWACGVRPENRGKFALLIPFFVQSLFILLLC